jgi:hypothetical protein
MKPLLLSALISALSLMAPVSAHMALISPPPLRHKVNPHTTNPDYSYTSPITAAQFPCKGYHSLMGTAEGASVASYSPGGTYQIQLEGSATHNGGSCQISLSYDKGKSFQVIKSIIGGCVRPNPGQNQQFSFTIPKNAGGGEALLAWSWINNTGNREFYMNCAVVTIGGKKKRSISGTAGRVEEEVEKRDEEKVEGDGTMHIWKREGSNSKVEVEDGVMHTWKTRDHSEEPAKAKKLSGEKRVAEASASDSEAPKESGLAQLPDHADHEEITDSPSAEGYSSTSSNSTSSDYGSEDYESLNTPLSNISGISKRALGPNLFVANLGNGCTTLGGTDVDYPDPGPNVERGPSQKVAAPVGKCGAVKAGGGGGSSSCDYYRGMGMYCVSGAAGRTTGLGAGLLMAIAASAMLW